MGIRDGGEESAHALRRLHGGLRGLFSFFPSFFFVSPPAELLVFPSRISPGLVYPETKSVLEMMLG